MTDDLAAINRRLKLLENEVEGERAVSRHILRKVTENEALLLEVRAEVGELNKRVLVL